MFYAYGRSTTILAPIVDCSRARDALDGRVCVSSPGKIYFLYFLFPFYLLNFYLFMDCIIVPPTEPRMKKAQTTV